MSSSNRVILEFVESSAVTALQNNLQMPAELAKQVVQQLSPAQMVILKENLSQFKQFFIGLVD